MNPNELDHHWRAATRTYNPHREQAIRKLTAIKWLVFIVLTVALLLYAIAAQ